MRQRRANVAVVVGKASALASAAAAEVITMDQDKLRKVRCYVNYQLRSYVNYSCIDSERELFNRKESTMQLQAKFSVDRWRVTAKWNVKFTELLKLHRINFVSCTSRLLINLLIDWHTILINCSREAKFLL